MCELGAQQTAEFLDTLQDTPVDRTLDIGRRKQTFNRCIAMKVKLAAFARCAAATVAQVARDAAIAQADTVEVPTPTDNVFADGQDDIVYFTATVQKTFLTLEQWSHDKAARPRTFSAPAGGCRTVEGNILVFDEVAPTAHCAEVGTFIEGQDLMFDEVSIGIGTNAVFVDSILTSETAKGKY